MILFSHYKCEKSEWIDVCKLKKYQLGAHFFSNINLKIVDNIYETVDRNIQIL